MWINVKSISVSLAICRFELAHFVGFDVLIIWVKEQDDLTEVSIWTKYLRNKSEWLNFERLFLYNVFQIWFDKAFTNSILRHVGYANYANGR